MRDAAEALDFRPDEGPPVPKPERLTTDLEKIGDVGLRIRIIDVAEQTRQLFGDRASEITGRPVPEHDYRFEVVGPRGRATYPAELAFSADQIVKSEL